MLWGTAWFLGVCWSNKSAVYSTVEVNRGPTQYVFSWFQYNKWSFSCTLLSLFFIFRAITWFSSALSHSLSLIWPSSLQVLPSFLQFLLLLVNNGINWTIITHHSTSYYVSWWHQSFVHSSEPGDRTSVVSAWLQVLDLPTYKYTETFNQSPVLLFSIQPCYYYHLIVITLCIFCILWFGKSLFTIWHLCSFCHIYHLTTLSIWFFFDSRQTHTHKHRLVQTVYSCIL